MTDAEVGLRRAGSRPEIRRIFATAALTIAGCLYTRTAVAHTSPLIYRVLWRTSSDVVLLTNRGLVFGDPSTGDWRLMCNEALDINIYERPDLAIVENGGILVGTSVGLQRTFDGGCSWERVALFGELSIPAIAQDSSRPNHVYLSTFGPSESSIRVSEDGGENFSVLAPLPTNDYVRSLRVAPGAPEHVYASGTTFASDAGYGYYVARSEDSGGAWIRFDVSLLNTELEIALLAVSPSDPDVVLAKATSIEPAMFPERLLVSRDGGASFSSPLAVFSLYDAAFSADGGNVWVAGEDGLWSSDDGVETFSQLPDVTHSTCVLTHGDDLFACGYFAGSAAFYSDGMNGVGRYSAGRFEPWMTLGQVRSTVACDADAQTTRLCRAPWAHWKAEVPALADAGVAGAPNRYDSGADAGAGKAASGPREADCGCGVPGQRPIARAALAWIACGLLLVRRGLARREARGALI